LYSAQVLTHSLFQFLTFKVLWAVEVLLLVLVKVKVSLKKKVKKLANLANLVKAKKVKRLSLEILIMMKFLMKLLIILDMVLVLELEDLILIMQERE